MASERVDHLVNAPNRNFFHHSAGRKRADKERSLSDILRAQNIIHVRDAGSPEGETFRCCIQTTQDGHLVSNEVWGIVTDGVLTFNLPPFSSIVLSNAVIEGSEN